MPTATTYVPQIGDIVFFVYFSAVNTLESIPCPHCRAATRKACYWCRGGGRLEFYKPTTGRACVGSESCTVVKIRHETAKSLTTGKQVTRGYALLSVVTVEDRTITEFEIPLELVFDNLATARRCCKLLNRALPK